MKRKTLALVLAAAMCLPLVACGGGDKPAENKPAEGGAQAETPAASADGEVAVFWYTFNDTYLSSVRSAMNKALDGAGLKYTDYDANGSQTTQTDAVDTAIAKGASLLIVNMVDSSSADAAQAVADKANAAGIPVIFYNRSIAATDDEAKTIVDGIEKGSVYVGTDYTQAGMMEGDMIGDYLLENYDAVDLNKDGKISYIMFKGDEANMEAIARTKYGQENADAKLEAAGKPALEFYDPANSSKYLVDQNAAWSAAAATDYMQTALSQYSTANNNMIELVIANNDEMALGSISALQAAGYNTGDGVYIPVFGVDATDSAKAAIAEGTMTGTIKQDAEGMANTIVAVAQNILGGKDKFDGVAAEQQIDGWRINIPYSMYQGE